MRVRLRDPRSPEAEAPYYERVYPRGYRHDVWPDHVERVAASVDLIRRYKNGIHTAADLSCGDCAILRGIGDLLETAYVGDLIGARGDYPLQRHVRVLPAGPLPGSLLHLPQQVDLFVLSETLEHLANPDALLQDLALVSRYLFLSTPVDEPEGSGNLEHYWGWGPDDIHDMLMEAGWHPLERQILEPESTRHLPDAYTYQLWMAVSR